MQRKYWNWVVWVLPALSHYRYPVTYDTPASWPVFLPLCVKRWSSRLSESLHHFHSKCNGQTECEKKKIFSLFHIHQFNGTIQHDTRTREGEWAKKNPPETTEASRLFFQLPAIQKPIRSMVAIVATARSLLLKRPIYGCLNMEMMLINAEAHFLLARRHPPEHHIFPGRHHRRRLSSCYYTFLSTRTLLDSRLSPGEL